MQGPVIDLTPYGLPGFNTSTSSLIRLKHVERDQIVKCTRSGNIIKFPALGLKYNMFDKLGEGTYGEAYRVVEIDDQGRESTAKYVAKLIKLRPNEPKDFSTFVREAVMHIIVHENTKTLKHGPFSPEVFAVGFANNPSSVVIIFDCLDNTLDSLLAKNSPQSNDFIFPNSIRSIAIILEWLQKHMNYNHRDLKGDNIMYKTNPKNKSRPHMYLIDFGFSCMTYNGVELRGGGRLTSCSLPTRDLAQLIYVHLRYSSKRKLSAYVVDYLKNMLVVRGSRSCPNMINNCAQVNSWGDTYDFLDSKQVVLPHTYPSMVRKHMDRILRKLPFTENPSALGTLSSAVNKPEREKKLARLEKIVSKQIEFVPTNITYDIMKHKFVSTRNIRASKQQNLNRTRSKKSRQSRLRKSKL